MDSPWDIRARLARHFGNWDSGWFGSQPLGAIPRRTARQSTDRVGAERTASRCAGTPRFSSGARHCGLPVSDGHCDTKARL